MQIIFTAQVPKDVQHPDSNEDAYEIAPDGSIAAVSDGASESFDSKSWSAILVHAFCNQPKIHVDWILKALENYDESHDVTALSWSKKAAFDRGSFATLLGIEYSKTPSTIRVLAIGDSVAILVEDGTAIDSYPYTSHVEFQQRPQLLCTKTTKNEFTREPDFYSRHTISWIASPEKTRYVFLMTDALAEWALRLNAEGTPPWATLLSLGTGPDLVSLVLAERDARRMRVDDVTLIAIRLDASHTGDLPDTRAI